MAKKLKMADVFTAEAYGEGGLSAADRRRQLKIEQALEYSGWRRYPTTASRLLDRIPGDWWDKYSAQHIGETMALLQTAFSEGIEYGKKHNDN